jgi:hypothetical protein
MPFAWEKEFSSLVPGDWTKTSDATRRFNCIAWAASDDARWWWPDPSLQYYWPPSLPRENSIECFVLAYESLGYELCGDESLESAFEKVAIYADSIGLPTHAARQLPDGRWTSKLGICEDITHRNLDVLNCQSYGRAVRFLKRPLNRFP